VLTVGGLAGAVLLAASALTRFGVFEAGLASAWDPRYTIVPQRRRRDRRGMNWRTPVLSVTVTLLGDVSQLRQSDVEHLFPADCRFTLMAHLPR